MKKLSTILCALTLLFGVVGVANAGKLYWSPQTGFSTWTPATNKMTWSSSDTYGVHFIYTGFTGYNWASPPEIDYSAYTKIHLNVADVTTEGKVQLKIVSTGKADVMIDLEEGENNILFSTLDIDITKIKELSLFGAGTSDGSAVITDVYMQSVKNVTKATLKDEITDINYVTNGGTFIMAKNDGSAIQAWVGNDPAALEKLLGNITNDLYYYLYAEKLPALDVDENGDPDDATYYRIGIKNGNGDVKPDGNYWKDNYMGYVSWGSLWSSTCAADKEKVYGRDGKFWSVWTIAYEAGNGFKFYNPARNCYMTLTGGSNDENFVKLYKDIELDINSEFDKEDNEADDVIFALANATGYSSETGILENGGWTFETPVDLSNWDYLIITLENTSRTTDTYIKIADNSGNYVQQNQYDPGSQPQMYFGQWNNHNAACISMDYLRTQKGLDISQIKSLSFTGQGVKISSVYLTDYKNTKLGPSRGRYVKYVDGDEVRNYDTDGVGKFGTICLPYVASCAGAEVYSILGKTESGIELTKVTGLLEAGKPYIYKASDVTGNDEDAHNVNFFRADLDTYDAATPGSNNGLIGTFTEINSEDAGIATSDFFVLSGNKIWNLEGATGEDKVTIGANKAYIKMSDVPAGGSAKTFLEFGDEEPNATDINAVEIDETLNGKFYDLQGREVENPTKGIYIVNGKKVVIK